MNHPLHYWWTWAALLEAGLRADLAHLAARADQMADHATPARIHLDRLVEGEAWPALTQCDTDTGARAGITDQMDAVYLPTALFHFGGPAAVRECRACREEDGMDAVDFFLRTLRAPGGELQLTAICIGLALHTAQDSYSHQGFWGAKHPDNINTDDTGQWWRRAWVWVSRQGKDRADWAIGHAQYSDDPDRLCRTWIRRGHQVQNRARFCRMAVRLAHGLRVAIPEALQVLKLANSDTQLEQLCKARIRSAGQAPVAFEPFDARSLEWKLFCQAAHNTYGRIRQ